MKQLFYSVTLLVASMSFGQTNTFPTSGNVGIGTTTPTTKLEVVGDTKVTGTGYFVGNTNEGGAIGLVNTLKNTNNAATQWRIFNMTGPYGNCLNFWTYGLNGYSDGPRVTFLDNGNVGLGTTAPTEKLEVAGSLKINNGNITLNTNVDNLLNFNHPNNNSYQYFNFIQAGTRKAWFGMSPANNFCITKEDGGNILFNGGNVGIGTSNPDSKLTVKGKIHAEEVKVDLLVPADYVFQKYYTGESALKSDYTMPTLAEIESYTKDNHHLPNVPSAKEIQQNGVSLGEMSNVLLQKIEELTLYVIEQNKKIEALETKLNNK